MLSILNGGLLSVIDASAAAEGWERLEERARRWAATSKTSPVAQLFLAHVLHMHGYSIRGNDVAAATPSENLREFSRYVQLTKAQLDLTKSVASIDPSWYELMMNIARYQSWPNSKFNDLFAEAISREPQFLQHYFIGAAYHEPKWGGSRAAVQAFINGAAARFASPNDDAMYTRMNWAMYSSDLEKSLVDCGRLMRGAKVIAREYPDPWNINHFAFFAATCGDKATFNYFAEKIGARPIPGVWTRLLTYQSALDWARP